MRDAVGVGANRGRGREEMASSAKGGGSGGEILSGDDRLQEKLLLV